MESRPRLPVTWLPNRSDAGFLKGTVINDAKEAERRHLASGFLCAIGAHTLWGLFPLFWALLSGIAAVELTAHRILWSFVVVSITLPLLRYLPARSDKISLLSVLRNGRYWLIYAIAAAMIATNWLAFVYAVTNDRVLEASLGYYINPLINVLLGVFILGERLGRLGWTAVGIAAVGVTVMTIAGGGLPWPALAMATSFACYGLTKKLAPLRALEGLWMETMILSIPALGYLVWRGISGEGAFGTIDRSTDTLLIIGGFVTVLPLTLFALAAQRVPLSTLGILQYVGPTLQFLVGVFWFAEPFDGWRIVGFVFVWTGLAVYLYQSNRKRIARNRQTDEPARVALAPARQPN